MWLIISHYCNRVINCVLLGNALFSQFFFFRTVVEKRSDTNQTVFRLQISTESISLLYLTSSGGVQRINFGENYIPPRTWSHIAIQVSLSDILESFVALMLHLRNPTEKPVCNMFRQIRNFLNMQTQDKTLWLFFGHLYHMMYLDLSWFWLSSKTICLCLAVYIYMIWFVRCMSGLSTCISMVRR